MEIEAKFRVPDDSVFRRLLEVPTLAGFEVGSPTELHLLDRYLDTADWTLYAGGYACRLRREGQRHWATLKGLGRAAGAVHRRVEHEVELSGPLAPHEWPRSSVRDLVLELIGEQPLVPLFEIQQLRHNRPVHDGVRAVALVSLDRVTVSYGLELQDRSEWLELEAELSAEGDEQDLKVLAGELQEQWGLVPEVNSKYERALALSGLALTPLPGQQGAGKHRLTGAERAVLEQLTQEREVIARRARLYLAWDEELSRGEIAERSGLSSRRVRYWLRRFRGERLHVFPEEVVRRMVGGPAEYVVLHDEEAPRALAAPAGPAVEETPGAPRAVAPHVPEPHKKPESTEPAKYPGVQPEDPMSEAGRKVVRFHCRRMIEHEPGTRSGEDIEALHDMRVATRRMRAALRVFEDYFDPKRIAPLLKGLRRTGQALGAVRDLDVFREKIHTYLATLPKEQQESLDDLLAALECQRALAREQMIDYLDGNKYRRFVEQLGDFVETEGMGSLPFAPDGGEPRPNRVRHVAPMAIYERLADVRAYSDWVLVPDPPLARLHALRIACKRLRYTCEFFVEVLGPTAKTLIKQVVTVQDHLGALQDAVVASGILRDYLIWGTWGHAETERKSAASEATVVSPGAAAYLAAQHLEMRRLLDSFPQAWSQLDGPEFSQLVAEAVMVL